MNDKFPRELIYKGKLEFDSASHRSLEKLLNFRWREQNTISSHVDLLLEQLLREKSEEDKDKTLKPERIPTEQDNQDILSLINSDEFKQMTLQIEYSGWKCLVDQIKANLDSTWQ